jgi:P2-related tail formation protein
VKVRDLAMTTLRDLAMAMATAMDLEKAMATAMDPEKVKATLMEILSAQVGVEENLPKWSPSL